MVSTGTNTVNSLPGGEEANSKAFVEYIVHTYWDDPYGYGVDVCGNDPEPWQRRVGQEIAEKPRVSVQSGHGIGKTRFLGSTIHWFMATRRNPQVVATAGTESQLHTKLWRELNKINRQAKNSVWFEHHATTFRAVTNPLAVANAIPWTEHNADAFQGTHEDHVLGVFDEASSIPATIWDAFSGAMSTKGAKWVCAGNPTKNHGVFFEACNARLKWRRLGDEFQGRWFAFTIASWESSRVYEQWIEDMKATWGEDSDEYRVRVKGLPPRQSEEQFISSEHVDAAASRILTFNEINLRWPLVLGVDVARQGNDKSVIMPRIGRLVPDRIKFFEKQRLSDTAEAVAQEVRYWREKENRQVRAIFVEGGGSIGWGVIEPLEEIHNLADIIVEVNPGAGALDKDFAVNKRCEMYGHMKDWFAQEVQIPNHDMLMEEVTAVKQKPDSSYRIRLESKDELRTRTRLGRSPDFADGLALTFGAEVDLEPAKKSHDIWDAPTKANPGELDWMNV